jgi:outer membrane protein assembly factor BamE (lipoprotein component of BamABCDE complex)
MSRIAVVCAALAVLAATSGCRSSSGQPGKTRTESRAEAQSARQAEMKASIPADSPLAKIDFGMTEGEVSAILGPPSSQDAFATGKAYNPFNVAGRDTVRTVHYYKGIGRVQFSHGSWGQRNGVVEILHDPSEPGYARSR